MNLLQASRSDYKIAFFQPFNLPPAYGQLDEKEIAASLRGVQVKRTYPPLTFITA
jgi:hypothetical protein